MIHPKTAIRYINSAKGFGVVALEFIPAGTITWALDSLDRTFTPSQIQHLSVVERELLDFYSFKNQDGNYVLCWDNGKYVNHSFKSNCVSTAYDFEVAVRDIFPGEELTDDYGYLNISDPFEALDEGTERKIVYPDDLLHYSEIWDQQLIKIFHKIIKVKQPLRPFISDSLWITVEEIAKEKSKMKSIKTLYSK